MQSQPTTLLCRYGYDPLDRLIATAQPSATERQRFYCKSRLATEIEGAIKYSIFQHGDQLLAEQQSEGDASVAVLLATDQQRSVLQTLKADDQQHAIAYWPYGHRLIENGLLSLMGFNGERPDPVTGHYLLGNGYRAFNPVLMRFNSPDSLSPFGKGGANSYAYCLGDPINMGDTSGHNPFRFLARAFSTTIKKLRNPFKSEYTSMGKVYMPPASVANMGLFSKLEGMPHIQDIIMRELPGKDLIAFSQVSKNANRMVQNAKLSPRSVLGSKVDLTSINNEMEKTLLHPVNSLISGEFKGVLPGDFARTKLGMRTRTHTGNIGEERYRTIMFDNGSFAIGSVIRVS